MSSSLQWLSSGEDKEEEEEEDGDDENYDDDEHSQDNARPTDSAGELQSAVINS